jgi:hypothetical protein
MSRLTIITRGGSATVPLAAMLATIPSLPRPLLGRLVTRMIDRMDELDGDADLETTGEDDEDTHDQEKEEAHN